jgi:serine/threonine-protein kinase
LAKLDKGNVDGGIVDLSLAIEINPKLAPAYLARGDAKRRTGDAEGAIVDYAHAIEIDPKLAAAYNKLAWALATAEQPSVRDGQRAVETALKACELSEWKNPAYVDTLAASFARAGNFGDAVKWQHRALESSRLANDEKSAQRLRLYEEGKPWPPD